MQCDDCKEDKDERGSKPVLSFSESHAPFQTEKSFFYAHTSDLENNLIMVAWMLGIIKAVIKVLFFVCVCVCV
jgi:hypothetical protein